MAPYSQFALALMAGSIHEHQDGHASRIAVWLRHETFTVQDDGLGIGLDRELADRFAVAHRAVHLTGVQSTEAYDRSGSGSAGRHGL